MEVYRSTESGSEQEADLHVSFSLFNEMGEASSGHVLRDQALALLWPEL